MTTNVRKRNRPTDSQPGIGDYISQGWDAYLDSGSLLSPNHDMNVAQRELDEYKKNNPSHTVMNDPDGVIRGLLDRQAGAVSFDPADRGPIGLIGKVAKKAKPKGGKVPKKPKGGVTAEEVLALSRKKQIPFSKWSEQDTTPNLLELSGSKPSIPDYPSPPRFFPTDRADIDRVRELVKNPKVSRRAKKYAKQGAEALPDSWYSTSPLYEIYVQELGEKSAKKKFTQDMEIFAATSPVSKVPNNIKIGSLYQHYNAMGKEIPENVRKAADGFLPDQQFPPPGYGAKTQGNHLLNSRRVLSGEGMSARKNPKPVSFAANLIGNEKVLTADTHYFRALGMFAEDPRFLLTKAEVPVMKDGKIVQVENKQGKLVTKTKEINPRKMVENGEMTMKEALKKPVFWDGAPKETEYALLEQYGQKIAKSLGMSPARFQEALWLGSGKLTGLQSPPEPFIRTLEKRVKYTAEQLGADPETVLRQYVRGEIPLADIGEDQQSRYGGLLA